MGAGRRLSRRFCGQRWETEAKETGEENGGCESCRWIGKLMLWMLWVDGETEAVELIPEELETPEIGVFVKNASSEPAGR